MFDVVVVGAGPAGTHVSDNLSSIGYRTLLIDLKESLGIPNHCSGLVDERVVKIVGDDLVTDKLYLADVTTPAGNFTLRSDRMFIVDRVALDRKLGELAEANGSDLRLRTRFIGLSKENKTLKVTIKGASGFETIDTKYLIGADGPSSMIRRLLGIKSPNLLQSVQFDVEGRGDRVFLHMDRKITPDFFSWEIPNNKETEIGASGSGALSAVNHLSKNKKVIRKRGGLVPQGPTRLGEESIFLIGDAAGLNKATTGGGLYAALSSGDSLTSAISMDGNILQDYNRIWKASFGKEILRDYSIRKIVDKFEKYYDLWVPFVKANINGINSVGDVDYPSRAFLYLLSSGILRVPVLLKYLTST
ncbi:MAG: NAD(P)/FAD-dependent oxidoreductase [Candidatus Thermoplasmatota archaeon]|nr:NAD(P)/FAD-dependent oxidoreductase [Candidatus Thermoplasmatota archaeon]